MEKPYGILIRLLFDGSPVIAGNDIFFSIIRYLFTLGMGIIG